MIQFRILQFNTCRNVNSGFYNESSLEILFCFTFGIQEYEKC